MIDAQALLGPAVVALYLKDCLLLLERDEAVLVAGPGGRWRAGFGLRDWRLGGREPYLCHPFKPFEAVYRLRWDVEQDAGDVVAKDASAADVAQVDDAPDVPNVAEVANVANMANATVTAGLVELPVGTRWLASWTTVIWLTIFVGLPSVFYGKLGMSLLLASLLTLYALIVGGLVFVYRHRIALGLDGRAFALLAFEVLACAPYAANLMRRACLSHRVKEDFLSASRRLLQGEQLATALAGCAARIDDELEAIDEASPRAPALLAARRRLNEKEMPDGGR